MFISRDQPNKNYWLDLHKKNGLPYQVEDGELVLFGSQMEYARYQDLSRTKGRDVARQQLKGHDQSISDIANRTGGSTEDVVAVQERNEQGIPIEEELTHIDDFQQVVDKRSQNLEPGETVTVKPMQEALDEREEGVKRQEKKAKRPAKSKKTQAPEVVAEPTVRKDGKPYIERAAKGQATRLSKQTGKPHTVVPVEGGFGVVEETRGSPKQTLTPEERTLEEPEIKDTKDLKIEGAIQGSINVWAGSNENSQFSNLTKRPFKFKGRRYYSVEHAYQTLKSGHFDSATYRKYQSGSALKIIGRMKADTRENRNIKLMDELVYESFQQNPEATQELLATGDTPFSHTQDRGVWQKAFPEALKAARDRLKTEVTDNEQERGQETRGRGQTERADSDRSSKSVHRPSTDKDYPQDNAGTKSTGSVRGGKLPTGDSRTGRNRTGRLGRFTQETAGRTPEEVGISQLRSRLRREGIKIPDFSRFRAIRLDRLADQFDVNKEDDPHYPAWLIRERGRELARIHPELEQEQAYALAFAEDQLEDQQKESVDSGIVDDRVHIEQPETEYDPDNTESGSEQEYNELRFAQRLHVTDPAENRSDIDTDEAISSYIAVHAPPSSHREVQEIYLEMLSRKFPTYSFELVDKPDIKSGRTHVVLTRSKSRAKRPFRTVTGNKQIFEAKDEAITRAKVLSDVYGAHQFKVKTNLAGYYLERFNLTLGDRGVEVSEFEKGETLVQEYLGRLRKNAQVKRSKEGREKAVVEFVYLSPVNRETGEVEKSHVALDNFDQHGELFNFDTPTITELGREANPFSFDDKKGDEKYLMWFNHGLSLLAEQGYWPTTLDKARAEKKYVHTDKKDERAIRRNRNVAITPHKKPKRLGDMEKHLNTLNKHFNTLTEAEKTLDEMFARKDRVMKAFAMVFGGLSKEQAVKLRLLRQRLDRQYTRFEHERAKIKSNRRNTFSLGKLDEIQQEISKLVAQTTELVDQGKIRKERGGLDRDFLNSISDWNNKLSAEIDNKKAEKAEASVAIGEGLGRGLTREFAFSGKQVEGTAEPTNNRKATESEKAAGSGSLVGDAVTATERKKDPRFVKIDSSAEQALIEEVQAIKKDIHEKLKGGGEGLAHLFEEKANILNQINELHSEYPRGTTSSPEIPANQTSLSLIEQEGLDERWFDPLNDKAATNLSNQKDSSKAYRRKQARLSASNLQKLGINFKVQPVQIKGDRIGPTSAQFVRSLLRAAGVKMNVLVADLHWYNANKHLLPEHSGIQEGKPAVHIPFGNFSVIVLNPKKSTQEAKGNQLYYLAHELGHALERHIEKKLTIPELAAIDKAYEYYQHKGGTLARDEWQADKVGAYLMDRVKPAEGIVNKIFKKVADKLRRFMLAASNALKKRFAPDATVSQVLDNMIADHRLSGFVRPDFGNPKPITVNNDTRQAIKPLTQKIRDIITSGWENTKILWKVGTFLWTADTQLRSMGDGATILAKIFHLNPAEGDALFNLVSGEKLDGSFLFRSMANRGRFWAELSNTEVEVDGQKIKFKEFFGRKGRLSIYDTVKEDYAEDVAKGIEELYSNVDNPQSKYARVVRKFMDNFYNGYLKEKLPTLGYVQNYFMRQVDTQALLESREDIKKIMVEHKTKEYMDAIKSRRKRMTDSVYKRAQLNAEKHVEKLVEGVLHRIETGQGTLELSIQLEQENYGPGFANRRTREFFANDEMVKALTEKGYMERDAAKALFNYVASSVKRAEFEATFGGYVKVDNAKAPLVKLTNPTYKDEAEFNKGYATIIAQYTWNITGLELKENLETGAVGARRATELLFELNGGIEGTRRGEDISRMLERWENGMSLRDYEQWQKFKELVTERKSKWALAKEMHRQLEQGGYIRTDEEGNLSIYSTNEGLNRYFEIIHADSGDQSMKRAQQIVRGYMGQIGTDMPREVQRAMSNMMAYQSVLVLVFSTLSSFPDIVGGVLRNRDASGMFSALRSTLQAINWRVFDGENYRALKDQAQEIGLIGQRISQEVLQQMFGNSYTSESSQKILDFLFHWNGQEKWTDFTRIVNLHVAKHSFNRWADLAKEGDIRAKKYLKEFGLTHEDVHNWDGEALNLEKDRTVTPDVLENRTKMQNAIVRFVEESIVRPNPAHRPVWASDPRFMLIWHLKSFFYSYGKVVVMPFMKTLGGAIAEAGEGKQGIEKVTLYGQAIAVQALPLLLAGVMLAGLAAFGWELKEVLQYRLFGQEPRSDELKDKEYALELLQRSGVLGAPQLLMDALFWGYGDASRRTANLLGPSMDHLAVILEGDNSAKDKLYRSTPLLNVLPGAKANLGH